MTITCSKWYQHTCVDKAWIPLTRASDTDALLISPESPEIGQFGFLNGGGELGNGAAVLSRTPFDLSLGDDSDGNGGEVHAVGMYAGTTRDRNRSSLVSRMRTWGRQGLHSFRYGEY